MAEDKLTSLPEDLLLDIVTKRMSGEAIRAFRCVCKTWHSYIVKHFCLINHGRYMVSDHGNRFYMYFPRDCTQVVLYSFNGCSRSYPEPTKLKFPRWSFKDYREFVGYSNGLACLVQYNKLSYDIALWNPSINTIQIVPKSRYTTLDLSVHLGFGFIPQKKDYKVVKLGYYHNQYDGYSLRVEVYSLISDSWKTISMKTEHSEYISSNQHIFVKGCAHWIARSKQPGPVILCFNMVEEAFHEIDTPAAINDYRLPRLTRFRDTLAIFTNLDLSMKFDVWVMKDYGVADSWSRLYRLTASYLCHAYGIMDNGKILEIHYGKPHFVYYDPVTEERIELN